MAGKIQGADMKTEAELIAAGTDKTALTRDTQIYVTANTINKTLDDAIIDGDIGGGSGSGGFNFLSSPDSTFSSSVGSWSTFDDGAVSTPVDLTGGSPTVITISRVTTFDAAGNLQISHSAANGQGEGAFVPFTVKSKHFATPCSITGTYQTSSGYADGDLKAYIYDVTNSVFLPVAPLDLPASTTPAKFKFEFQSSATGASYRLGFFCANTTATSYTVQMDDIAVGPTTFNFGAKMEDLRVYTGFTSSLTTNTTLTVIGHQVGDCFEGWAKMAFTGAPNAATNPVITLPSGMVIDTAKMIDTSGGNTTVGFAAFSDTGVASYYGAVTYISTTTLEWQYYNANANGGVGSFAGATSTTPFTVGNTDKFIVYMKFPVVGWSSGVQFSETSNIRRSSSRASTNSSQSIPNASSTIIDFATVTFDDLGCITTGGSWRWTPKKSCRIRVNAMVTLASGGGWAAGEQANLSIFKTGSEVSRALGTQTATHSQIVTTQVADEFDMIAGVDYIDIRMFQNSGGAITLNGNHSDTYVTISEIQGPNAIAASDKVNFLYGGTGTTANTGTDTKVVLNTKLIDTHGNQYDTSTGLWTCRSPGTYEFFGSVFFTNITAAAAGRTVIGYFQKNGAGEWGIDRREILATTAGISWNVKPYYMFECVVGDTVALWTFQNTGTNYAIQNTTAYTYMMGKRI